MTKLTIEEIKKEIERRIKEIDDIKKEYLEDVDYAQYHELRTLLEWISEKERMA